MTLIQTISQRRPTVGNCQVFAEVDQFLISEIGHFEQNYFQGFIFDLKTMLFLTVKSFRIF